METIIVAAIGAGGLIISTWLQAGRHKKIENTLGTRNGSSMVQQLDSLIASNKEIKAWTYRHEGRHDILERVERGCPLLGDDHDCR